METINNSELSSRFKFPSTVNSLHLSNRKLFSSRPSTSSAVSSFSVFNRLNARNNVKQSVLPAFLRVSLREHPGYLRKVVVEISSSEISGTPENYVSPAQVSPAMVPPVKNPKLEEVLLTVRNRALSRWELYSLKENGAISAQVIDASLSLLKQMNAELNKKKQCMSRVLIASTAFTASIFQTSKPLHYPKIGAIKYE